MHEESAMRNPFGTSHRQAGVRPSPGQHGSITRNSDLEDKHHHSKCVSPPAFLPVPPAVTVEHTVWCGMSLWSAGVSCPGCVIESYRIPESWNSWVGRDLKAHPVPTPCHGQGHLPLDRVAPSWPWDTARDGAWQG